MGNVSILHWLRCMLTETLLFVVAFRGINKQCGLPAQDICMAAVGLLQQMLASSPQRAAALGAEAEAVRQLEAAAQLLGRKADLERKYLERLEGGCCSQDSHAQPWFGHTSESP